MNKVYIAIICVSLACSCIKKEGIPSATSLALSINNVSTNEGNSGTKVLSFTVTQSAVSAADTIFNWSTSDGTALAGSDYVAITSTQATIPAGATVATLNVIINGDTIFEPDETFAITISSPSNATISTASGTGTIANDDTTLWAGTKQLGVALKFTIGYAIAKDTLNNLVITGSTSGGLDGNTLTGNQDAFITKYDSLGTKQWTKQLGVASQNTDGIGVATDTSDNVYVTGITDGGLDGNTLTGNQDAFITKYNSIGVKQWTKQLGVASQNTVGNGVATDTLDNVYVAGGTSGGFDGNVLIGTNDFFITKYDSSGVKQWTKQLGVAAKGTYCSGVTTDTLNNVFVTGLTLGGLDGNTLTGTQDAFIAKYNSSGVRQWTKQLGVALKDTSGAGVTADTLGNVFVTGATNGGLDGNLLTGTFDFFITKYNSSGIKQWTKQLGVASNVAVGFGVASDTLSNIFVTGATNGGLDGNLLTGTFDFFITKYNSSGVKQWTKQLGAASQNTNGRGVATDTLNNVFVTGLTLGGLDGNTLTGNQDAFITKYDSSGVKQ